jgi:TolB-like protein/DNA-binding winged helix-turn-helix (wHTH) protein/Tfp pilus assembly protein PilF
MSQSTNPQRILGFGSFEVDLGSRELRRQGLKISLQDQPFRLLALLLERAGEVVTREELRDKLWPADTFVDFDHSLNTAVRKLREALGDSAETPRYVETLARRGYRFVAPVSEPGPTAPLARSAGADLAPPSPPLPTRRRPSTRRVVVIVAVLASAALVAYWVGGRPRPRAQPGRRLTLAVLPFDNLSGDADQEYLSDGLTEEMITQLGRLEPDRLRVTARSSTWKYKHADRDIDRLRRELGADYVLEGSLRRAGERVRVTAQLIQAVDQTDVWAETYERDLRDVLVLQSEVARAVARAIALTLTPDAQARLASARSVRPESYQDYLRGRYFWNRRTAAALKQALGYFQRAIDANPDDARAYSGLADSYSSLGASSIVGALPPRQAMPAAKAAALKALEIDGTLAEAHTSLAMVHLLYDWDPAASEKEFRRALELDPEYTTAHHWYSHCLLVLGRTDESLAESKRALELEPLHLVIGVHLGWHYLYARRYDQAIEQFRKTLELDPAFPNAQRYAAWAYLQKGLHQEAITSLRAALRQLGRDPGVEGELGHALGVAGRRAEALAMLEGLRQLSSTRYVSPFSVALVHAGLGDRDQALAWLEKAYVERSDYMVYLSREPMLDGLRSDPRFAALVRRVGLPN